MKRVICVGNLPVIGKLKPSEQIMSLFNEQRVFNTNREIKGVFFVYGMIILQVLEGEAQPLAEAAYRLGRDNRLENFSVFVHENIKIPIFSKWQIRFHHPDSSAHIEFMRQLKSMMAAKIEFQSSESERLYKTLFPDNIAPESTPGVSKNVEAPSLSSEFSSNTTGFSGMSLSMTSWPKPTQVKLSSPVMKTCSLLCQRSINYDILCQRAIWNSDLELNSFLLNMQRLGILQASPIATDATPPITTQQTEIKHPKTDRFSQLLKKFISSPKANIS